MTTQADIDECQRLERMREHNATTDEQREEVIAKLAEALMYTWNSDYQWMRLGEYLNMALDGRKLADMKDTEIVNAIGSPPNSSGGETWTTFPTMTDEWRAELRAMAFDPERRHMVDLNELVRLGILKAGEP